jgi:hypothetical protein
MFSGGFGEIGGVYPTRVSPVGKRDPPQLPKISGNGVSVASMGAILHQYRPVDANEGGGVVDRRLTQFLTHE